MTNLPRALRYINRRSAAKARFFTMTADMTRWHNHCHFDDPSVAQHELAKAALGKQTG
jgi:hypothetical protein